MQQSPPQILTFPGSVGNLNATLEGGNGLVQSVTPGTTNGVGRYSIPSASSSRFWEVSAGGGGNFTITFAQDIAAMGFYGIDIGDFGGQLSLDLYNGNTLISTLTVPNTIGSSGSTDGSVLYFGLIAQSAAEQFTKDLFRNNPVKFYPGFQVRWCNSIPRGRGLFEDGRDSSGRRRS